MDCSIQPLKRKKGLYQISTTDFFFPLVNDPYVMGKIACANVLSDLYALGVEHCDNMLMLLSSSRKLSSLENDVCLKLIMRGFRDLANEADTQVTGGQTVINEDLLLGGVGMSVCDETEFIRPTKGRPGDVLVLTKPLGTQVAVNFFQWMELEQHQKRWNQCLDANPEKLHEHTARKAYASAMDSMSRLNRNAAKLMHKYKAHGATDVTGFGLLGHAQNMAMNQDEELDFEIHTLPIIDGMTEAENAVNGMFRLLEGYSAETSGGLLAMLPDEESAKAYCEELEQLDGRKAWIIGRIVKGSREARIVDNARIICV
uniref:Selenide, water dikinase n=1 Tax=Percolomonas cosmopolitus TaxID=63605 RepID=A0A7S1KSI1_9EUKA|mmetsp:Transcript_759/g.2537  ORF Transcript_759/g.2537 Transcript_759/m.2537 type:complete len:315 (+) Transcript_759:245-1189(+)|eukprot:CAMPEP_0117446604 /NCGR_PEP_ID=MMETSP0759-20121206/6432_1 /TAXON_ID=63605 /ORGANISM="Percolomonas cosmopolitus, Strain WS" /LENGTH=314 /DNA_ID=CAMNT_0005238887 /DNA_START=229 /DNA_END=1173 /DNA_ORIENTATION=-